MIYFDHAATSLQKPREVYIAQYAAMKRAGGYGRSGHRPALRAGELVYECRELAAQLFGLNSPEQVVFTMNATHALNQAIYALTDETTYAAISGYEHNSVVRPLIERGIPYLVMESPPFDGMALIDSAKRALNQGANLLIVNHMSNVFGGIIPLEEIDDLLTGTGAVMIVDASQSAGAVELNVGTLKNVAAVCMPGHKGLLGPQGTGMLLVCSERLARPLMQGGTGSLSNELHQPSLLPDRFGHKGLLGPQGTGMLLVCSERLARPLMQGGTGSLSNELHQPSLLPDRFESGTPNVPGIAGLAAGLRFILRRGVDEIAQHERCLKDAMARALKRIDGIEVFCGAQQGGVLSFRHPDLACEIIAERLAAHDICVRAGLHCAPLAHRSAGTMGSGTVRASFGPFNTMEEIGSFCDTLHAIFEKL